MNPYTAKTSQTNNQFLTMMKNIDRNYNKLQLLQNLFNTKDIIYVDPSKIYCIIQTEHYNKLKQEISLSKDNLEMMSKKTYEYQMQVTALRTEKEIYHREYLRLSQNQELINENILDISQKLKERNSQFRDLQQKIAHIIIQNQQKALDQQIRASTSSKIQKSLQNKAIQTSMTPQILYQMAQKPIIKEDAPQVDRISQIQTNLYEMFEQKITFFQQQLTKKLELLQDQQHSIQRWQNENEVLLKENQQLKQQIIDRNIQEQKLNIWRQNVFSFINRIENNISSDHIPSQRMEEGIIHEATNVQVEELKNEVVHLRGKMAEMKEQVKWVQDFMICQEEINEDCAVGLLVRLSQKLKGTIKNMLLQFELP